MPRRLSPQAHAVLDALAEEGTWLHGYDLSRRTGVRPGTLYPLLERLAGRGLLEALWVESPVPARPRRHAYRLTVEGHRQRIEPRAQTRVATRAPATSPAAGTA